MTNKQQEMISQLEDELRKRGKTLDGTWAESKNAESNLFLFGAIDGVTVTVAPNGLVNVPSVRTYHPPIYPTPVAAAASAAEVWGKQKARDDADIEKAKSRSTGHLGPVVAMDLTCGTSYCPCHGEDAAARQKRARGAFNSNLYRCS